MPRLRTHRFALAVCLVAGAAACDATPAPVGMERGAELYETCVPCHGANAQGNPDIEAPAIAGLPQWYIAEQLQGFQQGYRGDHFQDIAGMRMRPMALSLSRDGDIESVSQYVASFDAIFPESTLHGNAGAGAQTYTQICAACHGPEGMGMEQLHSPPIVQLNDWYLLTQLQNFKMGARGADPGDTWGATMRANSLALTDQSMRDVIAYVQTLR